MDAPSENFQVDLGGVLELLSEHLYSTPDVFVRELLQNAVDAVAARRLADDGFEPAITFECNKKAGTLTAIDNGIGLNADEVRTFLSRVGASIKREGGADRSTYIGQFGVGILSCFMVADELIVLTRRLGEEGPGIRWTASSDGTFRIEPTSRELAVGTRVVLKLKKGLKRYAARDTVADLLTRYGRHLDTPVQVGTDGWTVNDTPPWDVDLADDEAKADLMQEFGWRSGREPLDVIPLDDPRIGLRGVAFVLPELPANAVDQTHEVYLKRMFVTDRPGRLLPRWAGFTRCVLCSDRLRPTASREAFCEDDVFTKVGKSVGKHLRAYLARLAAEDRGRLALLLELQDAAFRQLAREDDDFFDAVIDLLPFETSLGRMVFGDFRREHSVVRVTSTTDHFRSVAALAAARGTIVFNGGYTHHEELLEKAVARDPSLTLEAVDGRDLVEQLGRIGGADAAAFERIAGAIERAVGPFGVRPRLASFDPADIPAVYAEGADSNLARSLRAAREVSRGVWADLLEAASAKVDSEEELAVLCFNGSSPVVRRLLDGAAPDVVADVARLLYVQALLLSQQPLTIEETTAFTSALSAMLSRSMEGEAL